MRRIAWTITPGRIPPTGFNGASDCMEFTPARSRAQAPAMEESAVLRSRAIRSPLGIGIHLVALLLLQILLAAPGFGQIPDATPAPGATNTPQNPCESPYASLIPECKAATAPRDGATVPPVRGGTPGSPQTLPGADGTRTNRPLPMPPGMVRPGSTRSGSTIPRADGRGETFPTPPPTERGARLEPPTAFQQFVASSIGEFLPLFGSELFIEVPTTFAPLDRIPVSSDYVIGPGDEILLRIWGQVNLNLALTVDRAGSIFIPQAGNIDVAGLRFQQLPGYLRSQLERVFLNFDLSVNMGELRSIQVFVVGSARRPGVFTVSSLSTLVNALFASGGPSSQGSMRRIQLKRGANVITEFDFYDLLLSGDKSKDVRLLPGDVVFIPPSGPRVAAAGSVRVPAIYELKDEEKVADVVRMAGGLSPVADVQRATIERIDNRNSRREVLDFRLDGQGMATAMGDGDVLNVATVLPRFANAVTLRGNVANPGRWPWQAGMRLRDVIPTKESLLTRNYWNKRNALGFVSPEERLAEDPLSETLRERAETSLPEFVADINWNYAVIERQNAQDLRTELVPFNLGKLILKADETQNLELLPGDVITIFSQADIRVAKSQQNPKVRLEGEFQAAGIYEVYQGETLGALVQRAGGLTSDAYLYGAEFRRKSTRLDQQRRLDQFVDELERDLMRTSAREAGRASADEDARLMLMSTQNTRELIERLRRIDVEGRIVLQLTPGSSDLAKLENLPLEDGDELIVPARPATVNVFGAVYNQNSFLHDADKPLKEYLRRAGGPSRSADEGRMFIIRADGSVEPKRGSGRFGNSFESGKLNPGDTIVVPEKIYRPGFLRGLRDWSQVFSQLVLGAAAINVLR